MTDTPTIDVDVDDNDEPNLYVVDSDEYQKTQKLKSINDSKQKFKEAWHNKNEFIDKYGGSAAREYKTHLAESLAMYGTELLPLIIDAVEAGLLTDDDLIVDKIGQSILKIIVRGCYYVDENGETRCYSRIEQIQIFRHIEKLQRELGLGLEIDEETEPAQI